MVLILVRFRTSPPYPQGAQGKGVRRCSTNKGTSRREPLPAYSHSGTQMVAAWKREESNLTVMSGIYGLRRVCAPCATLPSAGAVQVPPHRSKGIHTGHGRPLRPKPPGKNPGVEHNTDTQNITPCGYIVRRQLKRGFLRPPRLCCRTAYSGSTAVCSKFSSISRSCCSSHPQYDG